MAKTIINPDAQTSSCDIFIVDPHQDTTNIMDDFLVTLDGVAPLDSVQKIANEPVENAQQAKNQRPQDA